jgi:hypothetical protein
MSLNKFLKCFLWYKTLELKEVSCPDSEGSPGPGDNIILSNDLTLLKSNSSFLTTGDFINHSL